MKQTPLTRAIENIGALNISNDALFVVREYLQSLLPYEMECIEGAYVDGQESMFIRDSEIYTNEYAHDYFTQTFNK